MYQIDDPNCSASEPALPTDATVTPGWFTEGDPSVPAPATRVRAWFLNMLQDEIGNVVTAAGIAFVKGLNNQLLAAVRKLFGIKLTADLTLYVSASGSDSNTGLTSGSPFATIQKAYDTMLRDYNMNGFNPTIQVADGTYTTPTRCVGSPVGLENLNGVAILGNPGSPANVLIQTTNAVAIEAANGAAISLSGMKIQAGGTVGGGGATCLLAANSAVITINGPMVFGTSTGQHIWATQNSTIVAGYSYTIDGGATSHLASSGCATLFCSGIAVTLSGTPAFSVAFANCSATSLLKAQGTTFSGAATGVRYSVSETSSIVTNGGGASYFPGNAAGTADAGTYGSYS